MTELALSAVPGRAAVALVSAADTRWLLLGLALATGMEFYTFDSVNLVLADMTGTLGLSADEASWLLTVYSCSVFIGVPVSIWLAGHVGYKRFLIATTILFAIASMGCAVSSSLESLLTWRAIQGLAGAGLINWWRASVYFAQSPLCHGRRVSAAALLPDDCAAVAIPSDKDRLAGNRAAGHGPDLAANCA
jgi:DHA2 family multidrug resistance protein